MLICTQNCPRPERLDDYVAEGSAVRVIDVFLDDLDLSGLGFKTQPNDTGRPAYHPSTMLKLSIQIEWSLLCGKPDKCHGIALTPTSSATATTAAVYVRHRPETTLLYQIVQEYWPEFQAELASHGRYLPAYVTKEFDEYLKCGRLEHGFLRVRCESCHDEKLVAFSCKKRGFCPSCGARRMADSAALLVDEILPHQPMRQWVLSVPFPLRFLFASNPKAMSRVLGIVYRTIATHLTRKAGYTITSAHTGAVTLIQCFGGALNLNIHYHMLFLDGVYSADNSWLRFRQVKAPTSNELIHLTHTIAHRVARCLERQGLLERDAGQIYLTADGVDADLDSPMNQLLGS